MAITAAFRSCSKPGIDAAADRERIVTKMRVTPALLKRSLWKGPNIVPLPIVTPKAGEKPAPIRTQARSADILPSFVGLTFLVHNGKTYHSVTVTDSMVGRKLGEFSPTRKPFRYKQTKNK